MGVSLDKTNYQIETRLALLEDASDRSANAWQRLADDMDDIKKLLQQAIALANRVQHIETDLQGAWVEIEGLKTRESNAAATWAVVFAEHKECKPKVDTLKDHATGVDFRLRAIEERYLANKSLWSNVLGNTLSSLIWYLVCFFAGAIALWGGKGLLKL